MIGESEIEKDFSEPEKKLLEQMYTESAADRDKISATFAIHVGRMYKSSMDELTQSNRQLAAAYQTSIDKMIASNEQLSRATEKQANRLTWATWALVLATVLLFAEAMSWFSGG